MCADLIEKISRLAEDGEGQATVLARKIEGARGRTDAQVIHAMQEIEKTILEVATKLDLIDAVEKRELARLREDRNLCAHPSLRPLGEFTNRAWIMPGRTSRSHYGDAETLPDYRRVAASLCIDGYVPGGYITGEATSVLSPRYNTSWTYGQTRCSAIVAGQPLVHGCIARTSYG